MRANPETSPEALHDPGTTVMAIYPQTTCFYKGVIKEAPSSPADDYEVLFEDPSYGDGYSPPLSVAQRWSIYSAPKFYTLPYPLNFQVHYSGCGKKERKVKRRHLKLPNIHHPAFSTISNEMCLLVIVYKLLYPNACEKQCLTKPLQCSATEWMNEFGIEDG